jgi:hypothetical protein
MPEANNQQSVDILQKVEQYVALDVKAKQLDTLKKPLNAEIKAYMKESGIKELSTADVKVVYGVQERVSINEPKLLEKLKALGVTAAIKTVEVVDHEKLEGMIYNGELQASAVEECLERKEVETLTVKGAKSK